MSGAKTDKSGVLPYHLGEAGMPVIEQSPLVMECEVIDTYEIDVFKNYICTILNTYVEETMLDEKSKPDYEKLKPVLFEIYANDAVYQAHLKTDHFQKYKQGTLKMVKSLKLNTMQPMDKEMMKAMFGKMKQ